MGHEEVHGGAWNGQADGRREEGPLESSSRYWQKRYQRGETSGAGSYGRFAEYKAEVLNRFVAANGIVRAAEFGCGDGNQLKAFRFAQNLE